MSADVVFAGSVSEQASQDSLWIADKGWVIVQKKTFTNWVNNQLQQGNSPAITDVTQDFVSGEALLRLLEVIGGVSLEKYNHNPKLRIQKVENVNKALNFVHSRGVNLTNIGAEDIVDGNQKLILGLVWMIILKFSISYISEEGYEAKDALLLWCQRQTSQYGNDFKIKDFTYSWKNGLGFCALIHKAHPELLDYHSLDKNAAKENTELAFDVAEKKLNIPKLFEASDITDTAKPDERSVVTYLAQYFHTFTAEERKKKAAQKLAKYAYDMKTCYHLKDDYEERFTKLKKNILDKAESWENITITSYPDAKDMMSKLKAFRSGDKKEWVAERKKLATLLGTIQVKRCTYNLDPYEPPEGYLTKDMSAYWEEFAKGEKLYYDTVLTYIIKYKETIREKFNSLMASVSAAIEDIAFKIGQIHELVPTLESQLTTVEGYLDVISSMSDNCATLEQCELECEQANVYGDGELAPGTSDDIKYGLKTLKYLAIEKITIIKSQIDARKISDLDSYRLMELTETFHYMDKDKDGNLSKEELMMALKAEGFDVDEKSIDEICRDHFKDDKVTYEAFIDYMKMEDSAISHEQMLNLFKVLSSGKKYVSHDSLIKSGISRNAIEDISKVIPVDEEGNLNYELFLKNLSDSSTPVS